MNKTEKMNEPCYKKVQDFYTSDLKKPLLKEVNAWPQAAKSNSSSGVHFPCPHVCGCLSLLCLTGTLLGHLSVCIVGHPSSPLCLWNSALPMKTLAAVTRRETTAAKYWDIMDYMDPQGYKLCGMYIKDILCRVGRKNNICILHFGLVWGSVVVLTAVLL